MPIHRHDGQFINCIIKDYLYEYNYSITNLPPDFEREISYYWGGRVDSYLSDLKKDMSLGKNFLINIYLIYLDQKDEIDRYQVDEINDDSLEFYNSFSHEELFDSFDKEKVENLNIQQKNFMNMILDKPGLNKK